MLQQAPLPHWLRLEYDGEKCQVSFRCHCRPSEVQTKLAGIVENGSSAATSCNFCHEILQLRASVMRVADGGKPGSGR